MFRVGLRLLFILFVYAISFPSLANNGLNLVGFGSESLNMGGADVAVARDTTALNTNPAGLSLAFTLKYDGGWDPVKYPCCSNLFDIITPPLTGS